LKDGGGDYLFFITDASRKRLMLITEKVWISIEIISLNFKKNLQNLKDIAG
jgi:hypothetical protein